MKYSLNEDRMSWILTANPVIGCCNNCFYCYARKIEQRFKHVDDFSIPEFKESGLNKIKYGKGNVFFSTLSDIGVWTHEWVNKIFEVLESNKSVALMALSKSPERWVFNKYPSNFYPGVTVTKKSDIDKIKIMLDIAPEGSHNVCFEPLMEDLGEVDLTGIDFIHISNMSGIYQYKYKTEPDWVINLVNQARDKNIPINMKARMLDLVGPKYFEQKFIDDFWKIWNCSELDYPQIIKEINNEENS